MEKDAGQNSRAGTARRQESGRAPVQQSPDAGAEKPSPDRIRILAYEIYETRQTTGMLGDPVSDWLEAERRLGESPAPESAERSLPESGGRRPARTGTRRQSTGK